MTSLRPLRIFRPFRPWPRLLQLRAYVHHDRRGTAPSSRSCQRGPNPAGKLLICAETRLAEMLAGSASVCFETMVLLRGECLPVVHSRRRMALLLPLEYKYYRITRTIVAPPLGMKA